MHFLRESGVHCHTLFNSMETLAWKPLHITERDFKACVMAQDVKRPVPSDDCLWETVETSLMFQWPSYLLYIFLTLVSHYTWSPSNFSFADNDVKIQREIVGQVGTI